MQCRRLYLIRHCESAGQHPDAPLTSIGCAQAVALADRLASLQIDLDAVAGFDAWHDLLP
jgi:broad specificity phosphatase PhoE